MFGVKPRSAFIAICISMVGVDQVIDPREFEKLDEVLQRYGFTEEEVENEINLFAKMSTSTKKVTRYMVKCMAAITKLDEEMQKNLIQALTEIAEADEYFHDIEKAIIVSVKSVLAL